MSAASSRLYVVIGIVRNTRGQYLLSERRAHVHLGGLWEFPGGKLEAQETPFAALQRELFEELGIQVLQATPLIAFPFDYPELKVWLDFWQVLDYQGTPSSQEGQKLLWLDLPEIEHYPIPEASRPVLKALRAATN